MIHFPGSARRDGRLAGPFLIALAWIVILLMDIWQDFQGVNAGFVAELYERFRQDPDSLDAETRAFFERALAPPVYSPAPTPALAIDKIVAAVNLAGSIRKFGNLAAQLDPLGSKLPGDPSLILETHGITEEDLRQLPANIIAGPVAQGASNALEVIEALRKIYCTHSEYDYAHLRASEEREWLTGVTESGTFRPPQDPIDELVILDRLTQEGVFEGFSASHLPRKNALLD